MAEPRHDLRQVSIVTVAWNSSRWLAGCLASLAGQRLGPAEVIVVDNGSQDDSARLARSHGARVIENGANLGFCRGSNLGYQASQGGSVLFLNPDVVLDAAYLERAVAALEAGPRVGFIAGKLLRLDRRTLDSCGQQLARSRRTIERGYGEVDRGQFDEPGAIFSVCGAAALYRREALEDVAPDGQVFDEDFFAFHEDLDLGWRAHRRGWQGRYEPGAVGYHYRGATDPGVPAEGPRRRRLTTLSDELAYHAVKNRYLAMIKNDSARALVRDLPFVLAREAVLWGYLALRRPRVGWRVIRDRASRRRAWRRRRALEVRRPREAAA